MPQDAFLFLSSEHQVVETLFRQLEAGPTEPAVTEEIIRALSGHDAVERALLYPLLRDKVPQNGEGLAELSLDEHETVARLLADLEKALLGQQLDKVAELLPQLIGEVRAHVAEEETQVFPRLRQVVPQNEIEALGDRMVAMRDQAPTHPHPHTPRSGVGAMVVGKVAAAVDHLVDAARHRT